MRIFATYIIICFLFLISSCSQQDMSSEVIAENELFIVKGDSVIQGEFVAYAPNDREICSNYVNHEAESPVAPLPFRLAINMRDNELQPGQFHISHLNSDTIFVTAGIPDPIPLEPGRPIEPNSNFTIKADLTNMVSAFEEKGVWVTATGDSIFSDEFNGVWVIGNIAPLSWNIKSLANNNRAKLRPTEQKGIFELDITLNPTTYQKGMQFSHWSIDKAYECYPRFYSSEKIANATYNMALDAIHNTHFNEVSNSKAALAIILALAHIDPDLCKNLLKDKVTNNTIMQDPLSRLSAPIVNDRLIWAAAAWQLFCVNGDKNWLKYAYNIIKNTIETDKATIFCHELWLIHGCDSFTDIDSQYPRWMQAKDYFESIKLSTNAIYAYCHFVLAQMAEELGLESESRAFDNTFKRIKDNINQRMWNERKGYYCSYLINETYPAQSGTTSNLDQALCMLFGIADDDRALTLLQHTPFLHYGIPNTFPGEAAESEPECTPFIQAMWNIAAAQNGNENMLRRGLGAIIRNSAFYGFTNNRYSKADHLLNACGHVAMILKVFAGVNTSPDGIELRPFIPDCFKGLKRIKDIRFRNATYHLSIYGTGNSIQSISVDGEKANSNFFSANITGVHEVEIHMQEGRKEPQQVNIAQKTSRPFTPNVQWDGDSAYISNFFKKYNYSVVINDNDFAGIHQQFALPQLNAPFNIVYVVAKDDNNTQSHISKPRIIFDPQKCQTIALNRYATPGTSILSGSLGNKIVEFSDSTNSKITFPIDVEESGEYYFDLCYSNGATNTGNCPSCCVIVNTHKQDIVVLPQRGYGEWRNSGFSNMVHLHLLKGHNTIQLQFMPSNSATHNEVALLHYARIFKK